MLTAVAVDTAMLTHLLGCQTSSAIAARCPACRLALLHFSIQPFHALLTDDDIKWLALMHIRVDQ